MSQQPALFSSKLLQSGILVFFKLAIFSGSTHFSTAGEPFAAKAPPDKNPPVEETAPASRWIFRFGLGAAYRGLGDIGFETGSYSRAALLPSLRMSAWGGPGGAGAVDAFANRTYADGFVFLDDNTARPGSFLPGTTAYWGYENASQVRGGSLFYTAPGSSSTAASSTSRSRDPVPFTDDLDGVSPVLQFDVVYDLTQDLKLGGSLGFLFGSFDTAHSLSTFQATQTLRTFAWSLTDEYDLQGVIPPAAPYSGPYDHPGTSPLIDNLPTRRQIGSHPAGTETVSYFNQIRESLDLETYTFSLGPVAEWHHGRLRLAGGLGFAATVAHWDADFQETLHRQRGGRRETVARWQDTASDTEILGGFYLQGAVGVEITPRWGVSFFGRYDWSETLRGSVGPSDFQADLTGYTLGGQLTFTF